jgi:hypothetical protein
MQGGGSARIRYSITGFPQGSRKVSTKFPQSFNSPFCSAYTVKNGLYSPYGQLAQQIDTAEQYKK